MNRSGAGTDTWVLGLSRVLTIAAAMSSGCYGLLGAGVLGARDELGVGERRQDDRHLDAVWRELVGHRGGQPDHRELGARIDHLAGHGDHARHRGDVDDVAAAARTISGRTSWHPVSTPYKFTSIDERIDCSDCSRNGPTGITPALLISTSMWPPPSVRALSRNVANDSRSVTSSG